MNLQNVRSWNMMNIGTVRHVKKQPSTKQLTITRLPRNLIIHLKRFDNRMNKNTKLIDYPFNLDLTSFWANDKDDRLPPGVSIDELPARGQILLSNIVFMPLQIILEVCMVGIILLMLIRDYQEVGIILMIKIID